MGPRNLLAHPYLGTPVGITVEGANIITRGLIQFGQGAVRCHPYSYAEMQALMADDLKEFDKLFFKHIGHITRNKFRYFLLMLSRGWLHTPSQGGVIGKYERKIAWSSALFALLADFALARFGGNIKRMEKINGRFGDVLSYMYLMTCVLKRYEADGKLEEDQKYVEWTCQYCLGQIQQAFEALLPSLLGRYLAPLHLWYLRVNPFGSVPSDALGHELAAALMEPGEARDRLTAGIFIPESNKEHLGRLEHALAQAREAELIYKKIKLASKEGKLPSERPENLVAEAQKASVITKEEAKFLIQAGKDMLDAVEVDSFKVEKYLEGK